jgi:pyruvate dehydrogenase E1 component alpha subunit
LEDDVTNQEPNRAEVPAERLVEFYRQMLLIRRFDEKVYDLFMQNLVRGTTHLSLGQEAVSVGVCGALRPDDYVLCTYRGHSHELSRGIPPEAAMAEILGRATGTGKGKGGSMHITSVERGMLGAYAIVGAHIPIAAGAGWSALVRGTDQVTVCFFGDGTTNIGAFHEGVNLAAVWKLPVIYVCENNLYAEYTSIDRMTLASDPAAERARANGMPAEIVDGNDLLAVHEVASRAVARARSGEGPTMIEAKTYRHKGHSRTDPAKYRPPEEVEAWLERDPIARFRDQLIERELVTAEEADAIDQAVIDEVEAATQRAIDAPEPALSEALTDVFCKETTTWRN